MTILDCHRIIHLVNMLCIAFLYGCKGRDPRTNVVKQKTRPDLVRDMLHGLAAEISRADGMLEFKEGCLDFPSYVV